MYSNIHEWLKVFQNYVQLTRLKIQTSQPKNQNTTVQIFERSLQNNRFCFVELAYKGGFLSAPDYAVLDEWYKWIESNIDIKLDLIGETIYINMGIIPEFVCCSLFKEQT